jgi:heptosyltransferase-2
MRFRGVDLAIDVRGEFPLAVILWLSGARTRLGWNSGGGGFLLTHSPRYVDGRAEVDSRRALLGELGIAAPDDPDFCRPRWMPSSGDRRWIADRLAQAEAGGSAAGPRIVLHLGAGTPAKRWPLEHWRELLFRISWEHDARLILVGGAAEQVVARDLLRGRAWPNVADWTGSLSIGQLAALLEQAELVVSADSGPAHLAAAVGAPVVVLFSGTNRPRQWAPCGPAVTVLRHPVPCSPCHRQRCPLPGHDCMGAMTPIEVSAAIGRGLSPSSPIREEAVR